MVTEAPSEEDNKHECEFAFRTFVSEHISRKWFLGSCASCHLTNQKDTMSDYRALNAKDFVGSATEGAAVKVAGAGNVCLR